MRLLEATSLVMMLAGTVSAAEDGASAADAPAAGAPAADAPAAEPVPSEAQGQMYRALSIRHPAPACADVEALSATPVDDLLWIVDNVEQPPWAGMRAAQCLADGHADAVQPRIEAWVSSEATRGLAYLVPGRLDRMPEAVGVAVARAALAGPLADDARPRIARASSPVIRVLAE